MSQVGSILNLKDLKDLRKGEVLAYVGLHHNLKDLKDEFTVLKDLKDLKDISKD